MTRQLSRWKGFGQHSKLHSSWAEREEHVFFSYGPAEEESAAATAGLEDLPTILANRIEQVLRLRRLEENIEFLENRVRDLESAGVAAIFQVQTFAPEPYRLLKPIPVSVHRFGDEFVATFADANINSAGDNPQEAFSNVKELILDTYDRLSGLPTTKLGPGPLRQLAVLREFIDAAPVNHERAR